MRLLCGRICEPSTDDPGAEQWTSSWRATRVSRSQQPVDVLAKTIRGTCGHTFAERLRMCSPGAFTLRTCRDISLWDSERSAKTWSGWVTRLRLLARRRQRLARAISASGCSSSDWPTATVCSDGNATDNRGISLPRAARNHTEQWPTPRAAENGNDSGSAQRQEQGPNPGLKTLAAQWPTPVEPKGGGKTRGQNRGDELLLPGMAEQWMTPHGMGNIDATGKRGGGGEFAKQAETWPTPSAANDDQGADRPGSREGAVSLVWKAELWATPSGAVVNDGETAETFFARREELKAKGINGNGAGVPLTVMADAWPTPNQRDHKGSDLDSRNGGASLPHFVETGERTHCSRPAPVTATSGERSSPPAPPSPRPRLNPIFVAWLMGWPLTALGISDCSGTALSPCKRPTPSCGCGWLLRMRAELTRLVGGSCT